MSTGIGVELQEWRATARAFFAAKSSPAEVRRVIEAGESLDRAVWDQMAEQMGLQALIVPEEFGGAGFGYVELGIVMEEMGRSLYVGPFLTSAVMATAVLLEADDDDARQRYLPAMAAGEEIATIAVLEADGRWDPDAIATAASESADGWQLTGEKHFVADATVATRFLVTARAGDRLGLFAVGADSAGVAVEGQGTLDETRPQGVLKLSGATAQPIAADDVWATLTRARDRGAIALSAEQVGGAERALEMAVEYAKDRVQYGRPIGSFQAIKHKCADMLVHVQAARAASRYALRAVDAGGEDVAQMAGIVKPVCSEGFYAVAAENIQIHGGIGVTWEHDAHLYFKRARADFELFGSPAEYRDRIGSAIGV